MHPLGRPNGNQIYFRVPGGTVDSKRPLDTVKVLWRGHAAPTGPHG